MDNKKPIGAANYDRPTDKPTDRQTDRQGHKEVSLLTTGLPEFDGDRVTSTPESASDTEDCWL